MLDNSQMVPMKQVYSDECSYYDERRFWVVCNDVKWMTPYLSEVCCKSCWSPWRRRNLDDPKVSMYYLSECNDDLVRPVDSIRDLKWLWTFLYMIKLREWITILDNPRHRTRILLLIGDYWVFDLRSLQSVFYHGRHSKRYIFQVFDRLVHHQL